MDKLARATSAAAADSPRPCAAGSLSAISAEASGVDGCAERVAAPASRLIVLRGSRGLSPGTRREVEHEEGPGLDDRRRGRSARRVVGPPWPTAGAADRIPRHEEW